MDATEPWLVSFTLKAGAFGATLNSAIAPHLTTPFTPDRQGCLSNDGLQGLALCLLPPVSASHTVSRSSAAGGGHTQSQEQGLAVHLRHSIQFALSMRPAGLGGHVSVDDQLEPGCRSEWACRGLLLRLSPPHISKVACLEAPSKRLLF